MQKLPKSTQQQSLEKYFQVHDSKAGFPYEYLEKYGLKISNNQLFVKKGSTHISNDFVDVVGNRVIFTEETQIS